MRTVTDLKELVHGRPTVVTIGAFDGVHRGHHYLITQAVERARQLDYESAVITFDPRPLVVLRPGTHQLTDADEKARLIAGAGATTLVVLPFTAEFSKIAAGDFLLSILEHINLSEVWIGADFAFGHNREGGIPLLIEMGQQHNFAVHVVARKGLNGERISSTVVRERLAEGDVAGAAVQLGHYFRVSGTVVSGFGRGINLGFPTANLRSVETQTLPATGIYAAYLQLDNRRLSAAVSVGTNPTFGGAEVVVEAHALDFDDDLRGRQIAVDFVERVRDEKKFDGVKELVEQMQRDVEAVRAVLGRAHEPREMVL